MRTGCVLAVLISGASAEISGRVAESSPHACQAEMPPGDATTLLQQRNMKVVEHAEMESSSPCVEKCKLSEWSAWTGCSSTTEAGTRTRSRTVLSPGEDTKCGCLQEAETCFPVKVQTVLSGTVKDAKTNSPIEGATVEIPSQGLQTTTGPDGDFHFAKVAVTPVGGAEVLTAKANTYADYKMDALFISEGMSELSIKMVKPTKPGEWTIVMTWEKQPVDLDSTTIFGKCLVAPDLDGATKSCTDDASKTTANLDIDNQNKMSPHTSGRFAFDKPETTTLTNVNGLTGPIVFRVDNWERISNPTQSYCEENEPKCAPIADSKAKVEVHGPDVEKTYTVGKDGVASEDGKKWFVFSIDPKSGVASPCQPGGGCE